MFYVSYLPVFFFSLIFHMGAIKWEMTVELLPFVFYYKFNKYWLYYNCAFLDTSILGWQSFCSYDITVSQNIQS